MVRRDLRLTFFFCQRARKHPNTTLVRARPRPSFPLVDNSFPLV
jgi:hypothetical protein